MNRALLAGALWGVGACAASASYSSSFSAGVTPLSSSPSASPVPLGRTAQIDRSPPPASVVPSGNNPQSLQLVPGNPLAAAALAPTLALQQQQRWPAAKPAGEPLGGVLSQGQAIQTELQLRPGHCYTVLGYSPSLSVFSMELTPKAGDAHLVRSVDGVGVLDETPCFQVAMAQGATLRLSAQVGAGPVVAQLYER